MIAALALAATALAPLQAPWNQWHYERRINTPPKTATFSFVVPPSLYAHAQTDLGDIRIISENEQVPFAIVIPSPSPDIQRHDAHLEDIGFVRNHYSQAVADLGTVEHSYQTLEIQTAERSFSTFASVEASDDRKTWRLVKINAPLYDYSQDGLDTNLCIHIAPTTSRFIRIGVEGHRPFTISGVRAAENIAPPLPLTRYAMKARRVSSTDPKTSVYILDGVDRVPLQRVDVYAGTSRYARDARLEFDDGSGWQSLATSRLVHAAGRDERSFTFDEVQLHKWRLVVDNGDDLPLRELRVYAFGTMRRVVFDAKAGRTYLLIYGNSGSEGASYDYADTHTLSLYSAPNVVLGAPFGPSAMPSTTSPLPWSERHRWVLWLALACAACGVGTLALRALRGDSA